jgi:hypothetical protein
MDFLSDERAVARQGWRGQSAGGDCGVLERRTRVFEGEGESLLRCGAVFCASLSLISFSNDTPPL